MPEIPRFKPQPTTEEPAPNIAGLQPAISLMRTAREGWVQAAETVEKGINTYLDQRRKAKAIELGNSINDDIDKLAESLNNRDPKEYDRYENDMTQSITSLKGKYDKLVGSDRILGNAINAHFGQQTNMLMRITRDKRREAMIDVSTTGWLKSRKTALGEYADAPDPTLAEIAENRIQTEGNELVRSGLMKGSVLEKSMETFKDEGQRAQALRKIQTTPIEALDLLLGTKAWPDIDPLVRTHLANQALIRINQDDAAIKTRAAETEKFRKLGQDRLQTSIYWNIATGGQKDANGNDWTDMLAQGVSQDIADHTVISGAINFQKSFNEAMKKADREENPVIKAKLTSGLYGSNIMTSENDLNMALANGDININSYKEFLGHRTSKVESLQKEIKTETQRRQDKGFEHGEKALGLKFTMEGPGAAVIDREAKSLHADALREYYGLVYKDGIDVDKALDTVTNRYLPAFDTIKDRESKKLRKSLIVPNRENLSIDEMLLWLDVNRSTMPPSTFQSQLRMLRDIEGLEKAQSQIVPITTEQKEKKKYKVVK